MGSSEKDVHAESVFKAAGAEVVSDARSVRSGFVTVGAPLAKHLALSVMSLRAARLPGTHPNACCPFGWELDFRSLVSPLSGFLAESVDPQVILPLPRRVCVELSLLSALTPLMCSNLAVDYLGSAFASGASLAKGAVVKASVPEELSKEIWLDSDKKGHYVVLENGAREILRHLGETFEEAQAPPLVKPKASPLLYFDFVEICGGVGAVSEAARGLGLSVAPPLDLTASRHYDLTDLRLLEWIIYMIEQRRFPAFLLEPPCTTFSPAAHPCLRSYKLPYGFCRENPRVIHGNTLAFRSLVLLRVGRRHRWT